MAPGFDGEADEGDDFGVEQRLAEADQGDAQRVRQSGQHPFESGARHVPALVAPLGACAGRTAEGAAGGDLDVGERRRGVGDAAGFDLQRTSESAAASRAGEHVTHGLGGWIGGQAQFGRQAAERRGVCRQVCGDGGTHRRADGRCVRAVEEVVRAAGEAVERERTLAAAPAFAVGDGDKFVGVAVHHVEREFGRQRGQRVRAAGADQAGQRGEVVQRRRPRAAVRGPAFGIAEVEGGRSGAKEQQAQSGQRRLGLRCGRAAGEFGDQQRAAGRVADQDELARLRTLFVDCRGELRQVSVAGERRRRGALRVVTGQRERDDGVGERRQGFGERAEIGGAAEVAVHEEDGEPAHRSAS